MRLASILDEIVFVGGAVLGLLITDPAASPVRQTADVDVIAEIATHADYLLFSERLRRAGLAEDAGETPLLCRWRHGGLILDVLPLTADVLGFTNRWYEQAYRHAAMHTLPGGVSIRVITAPYFLGTKIEAFRGRGRKDYQASHDLEDFVAIIEGRDTLLDEIRRAPRELQLYLAEAVSELLSEPRFMDFLSGFVVDNSRVPMVEERLRALGVKPGKE